MLEIEVKASKKEVYNEDKNEFVNFILEHDYKFSLEHSLVSISKWESKWHKPFLSDNQKTDEELLDYIRCMIVTPNIPDTVVNFIEDGDMKRINSYIQDPMTATTFHTRKKQEDNLTFSNKKPEIITSEIIYYWMIDFCIPVEFQKWHINRLLTLIRVCKIKNSSNDKATKKEAAIQNRSLSQARRMQHGVR